MGALLSNSVKYYRRGSSYEIDTDRRSFPRLHGIMLRSAASRGGGPGSRWTYPSSFGDFGNLNSIPAPSKWKTRVNPATFTNGMIYVMKTIPVQTTTFTIWTTETTFTIGMIFQYELQGLSLLIILFRASTKTDALSGALTGDIVLTPPAQIDLPCESQSSELLNRIFEYGNPNARRPPCGHTEAKILRP